MAREFIPGEMEIDMMVNGKMEKKLDTVCTIMLMVIKKKFLHMTTAMFLLVNLLMGFLKEKVY